MSIRRTAVRRTLRLAVATSLVAAPAVLVLGTSQAAEVTDSMERTVSAARTTIDTGVLSSAVGQATATEAGRPVARASVIADKMVRPDARPSRSGARVVPLVRAEPMRVGPEVTLDEKPDWTLPVNGYDLTGRFGAVSGLWSTSHTGLDFAAPSGTPIRSVADGVVKESGYDGAYGYKTVVSLPDGGEVWYCHQNEISVSKGQSLSAGEVLGYVGTSGNTTGSHLHLEIRHGDTPTDPQAYLAEQGVTP
jgi:murein DD-endopeptidase MepM/ murein hydrolase activator NlpD